jgi:hypothetical protein
MNWKKTSNPKHGMPPFDAWITKAMWDHQHAHDAFDDLNVVALSIPICTKAKRYIKIKAYLNHFMLMMHQPLVMSHMMVGLCLISAMVMTPTM